MKLLTHESQWNGGETVVALGMFDGVHEGHATLMRKANDLAAANDLTSVVYTFSSHPMATFAPDRLPPELHTRSEKVRALSRMGIDVAVLRPFDRSFAALTPEEFVRSVCDALHPRHIVIGFNYSFGAKGAGRAEDMIRLGRTFGFETHVVPEVQMDGLPVSSTRIRAAIAQGDMELAARLLGGPYALSGVVMHGKKLGRRLDFPTANLSMPEAKALPPRGVYACLAYVRGQWYPAAVNVGRHPTVPEGKPTIEANLIDYDGGDCYGCHMRLTFFMRLREEKKFDSLEQLREEVMLNREQVRTYFDALFAAE
ncbi:MAG: bifunctional riboflavin kinase/FAD synthetase [Clostridia bacterium]|nr:bifunctional riboflavin kinase/FAD synthetase [Clostridia bacterium]